MKLQKLVSLFEETNGILQKYKHEFEIYEAASKEELCRFFKENGARGNENLLLIAATDESIAVGKEFDVAVLGYLSPEIKGQSLSAVDYLVEGWEEVEVPFLEKAYQRYHHIPWVIAETKRCRIRELTMGDMEALFDLYSDKELTKFIDPLLEYEEETKYQRAYIDHMYRFYGYGMWLVFCKDTGELIGRAGLEHRELEEELVVELGYLIKKRYQGQGYAKEVCQAILDYAKEELEITNVNCFIKIGNTSSIKMAESMGFFYTETIVEQDRKMLRFIRK